MDFHFLRTELGDGSRRSLVLSLAADFGAGTTSLTFFGPEVGFYPTVGVHLMLGYAAD